MNETYSHSKANVTKRKTAVWQQERPKLLAALLLILALAGAWAYQAMIGVSVVDVWDSLSDSTRIAVQVGLLLGAGVTLML